MGATVGGVRPKSTGDLLAALHNPRYRRALDYDLRLIGLSVRHVEAGVAGWNETWGLVCEILHDPFSRLSSAVRGDRWLPSPEQVQGAEWAELWVNAHAKKGTIRWEHPRPWVGSPDGGGAGRTSRVAEPPSQADIDHLLGLLAGPLKPG